MTLITKQVKVGAEIIRPRVNFRTLMVKISSSTVRIVLPRLELVGTFGI